MLIKVLFLGKRLKKSFDERKMPMQDMLIPLVFTVTTEQMATFEDASLMQQFPQDNDKYTA